MAKDSKFGTFGGVFTPSILTILGVIMYLRLPWVVGQAGLGQAVLIILVAHVISVATGLSISSIATDKNVGAGGPYYIVSRSLGLPIGGTLGLALFVGLCASISLYVIGFSESVLATMETAAWVKDLGWQVSRSPNSIRVTGTLTLLVMTGVTIISTAFAIKTQYVVLGAIGLSLVSIFMGDPSQAAAVAEPTGEAPGLGILFGIFFPAVTGFTAGVNMSGDLRNPKKSIPTGTMGAIVAGLAVYLSLAIYLFQRVDSALLIGDPEVLLHIAWSDELVNAGIWGATFSSGLGSILGAPRILQALGGDRIVPTVFAKGHGPTKEPRNALILAFVIAEAGILLAELDAIANIVSMVFLATYAFLNISCAIEAKVSPDFRPAFRIPATVSVVGAAVSVTMMIQIGLPAMIGATLFMVGLFAWLQRRQLQLESGDAWEGIWASIIRSGLFRLTHSDRKQRNWRPNILAFRDHARDSDLADFARGLIGGNGILNDFSRGAPPAERSERALQRATVGVFEHSFQPGEAPFERISTLVENYGFPGLEPNTLLMPWAKRQEDERGFVQALDHATEHDFNVLLYAHHPAHYQEPRIDVWWRPDAGNIAFSLAVLRFLTRAAEWEQANLRFLLLSPDSANNDNLRTALRRILRDGRIAGSIKVMNDSFGDRELVDRVRTESSDAALTLFGLPNETGQLDSQALAECEAVREVVGKVLFLRGASSFPEVLPTGRAAAISEVPPMPEDMGGVGHLPDLVLSEVRELARATTDFSDAYQRMVGRLAEQCLQKVYGRHVELVRDIKEVVDRNMNAEKLLTGNPRRRRNAFNRVQSSWLMECQARLDEFAKQQLPDLRAIIEGGVDVFAHDEQVLVPEDALLVVERPLAAMQPQKTDSSYVRRFKRRRRFGAKLFRRQARYRIPIAPLRRFYFQEAKRLLLAPAIRSLTTETHQLIVQLGKTLNSSRVELDDEERDPAEVLDAQRTQLLEHLDALDRKGKDLLRRRRWALIVDALQMAQGYADDIERLDFLPHMRKERAFPEEDPLAELDSLSERWVDYQRKLLARAHLALSVSSFQHRLTTIVARERQALSIGIKNGALSECERLAERLRQLRGGLDAGPAYARTVALGVDAKNVFDGGPVVDALTREAGGGADVLPPSLMTLSDESIQALEEGRSETIEEVQVPVRRLCQFLVESELIAGLSEAVAELPKLERHALGVAQDVERLVTFQLTEFDAVQEDNPEEFREQMLSVIDKGIERLRAEIGKLSTFEQRAVGVLDDKLHVVIDGSNPFELSTASDRLDQFIRVQKGRRAVSGLQGYVAKRVEKVRRAVVHLVYRRSQGVLLARERTQVVRSEQVVDRVAAMVRSQLPRPEVAAQLPFYYRQLFLGQSGTNDNFWVGRRDQLARAREALRAFDAGSQGALFVVGDRLSGKSALLQRFGTEVFEKRRAFRVHAPPGGTMSIKVFDRALSRAIESQSDLAGDLAALPRGSVVIIDDLELFWERGPGGLAILERVEKLIKEHRRHLLFVLSVETQAFRFIHQLLPLSDHALAVLTCGPLPAESLQAIVTLRHASTGLQFQLGATREESVSELAMARLFSAFFDHTGGSIGATLRAWVAAIQRYKGDVLEIKPPSRTDAEALDGLRPEWLGILIELFLHKQLGPERLRRVTGLPREELRKSVDALVTMGLVVESHKRILELQPALAQPLRERLSKRGLLA